MVNLNRPTSQALARRSIAYRRTILQTIMQAGGGHTGGDLSCIDILNVLYNTVLNIAPATAADPDRDRYIQSKGHAAEALYTVLADRGFFPAAELATLGRYGARLAGHPTRDVPGVEHNTGALGHGIAFAVGVALAGKLDGRPYRVYTLLGDGELAEGSVWEASMLASHYRLDNLVVIIDRNTLQITGRTEQVNALEPLTEKCSAFGYAVQVVDGHDIPAIMTVFDAVPFKPGQPSLILARTIKGKGISFIQDVAAWHHKVPTNTQLAQAFAELDATEAALDSMGVIV